MQHLAAAAMGRAHHMGRREHMRFRPSAQGHPRFVLVSGTPAGAPSSPASSSPAVSPPQTTNNEPSLATVFTFPHYSPADRDGSSTNSLNLRSRYIELEEPGSSNSESLDTFKSRMVAASSRCLMCFCISGTRNR
jgi:E3 ubiquitin-protein ligase RHF